MGINGINPLGAMDPSIQKTQADSKNKSAKSAPNAPVGDTVEVSKGTVAQLASEVMNTPDVESSKLEELQQAIAEGRYNVPAEDIATSILDELI